MKKAEKRQSEINGETYKTNETFGKQNTGGNVSKISVGLACYRQIGSKFTNHGPLA